MVLTDAVLCMYRIITLFVAHKGPYYIEAVYFLHFCELWVSHFYGPRLPKKQSHLIQNNFILTALLEKG